MGTHYSFWNSLAVSAVIFGLSGLGYAGGQYGAIASKELAVGMKSMSTDTNFDGKPDRWDYYERNNLVRIEYDHDADGNIDEKHVVDRGKIVEKSIVKDGKVISVEKVDEALPDKIRQS